MMPAAALSAVYNNNNNKTDKAASSLELISNAELMSQGGAMQAIGKEGLEQLLRNNNNNNNNMSAELLASILDTSNDLVKTP